MTSQKGQSITIELEAKNTIAKARITGEAVIGWNGNLQIKLHNKRSVENLKLAADKLDYIYEVFGHGNESSKE